MRRALAAPLAAARRVRRALRPTVQERAYRAFLDAGGDEGVRYDYRLGSADTIIDVGGYRGEWTARMLERYGCSSYVFEPVGAYAQALRERFADDGRVTVLPFALGAVERDELIAVARDRSSLLQRAGGDELVSVRVVDVARWWSEAALEEVAVMKINIEGGEYELLPRLLECGIVSSIRDIQVQFHSFVPQAEAKMRAIQEALARTHAPTYRFPFVWENWRRRSRAQASPM